jgi:uncharacterized protein (TIGR03435 family)
MIPKNMNQIRSENRPRRPIRLPLIRLRLPLITTYSLAAAWLGVAFLANSQTKVKKPEFDVASLKPVLAGGAMRGRPMGGQTPRGGPGTSDPGRVTIARSTLRGLLMRAFEIPPGANRLVTPPWMSDIGHMFSLTATMPPTTTRQDFHLMLQNLLIERFRIQLHHEMRVFRSYDLVVAPGGPKLRKSTDAVGLEAVINSVPKMDSEGYPILPPGHGMVMIPREGGTYAAFRNYSIAELTQVIIAPEVSRRRGIMTPVDDRTGLTGRYDFRLRFDSQDAAPGAEADSLPALPSIFKAVGQLGLRLVGGKQSQVDMIVIDHAEKTPVQN